jgi:teichuronic acid biosynthesis glycosyltransferase TuaC
MAAPKEKVVMKIISICHMFPNVARPHLGIFVKERLLHVAKKIDLTMVAPVPSFPFLARTSKYAGYGRIGLKGESDGMTVFHPRYFMIPKYLKSLDARFYERSLRPFVRDILQQTGGQVLDAHWVYPDGLAALEWGHRFGKNVVVTVRGNEALHYYQYDAIRKLIVEKMSLFDHVISVSEDLKEKLISDYRVSPEKITVIHNGVDKDKFKPMDKAQARSLCGLTEDCRYILAISRLSSEKGLEYLLESMMKLKTENVKLALIGDGPLYGTLNNYVKENNLSGMVSFVGSIPHEDLNQWYNAADVFCLSSIWEGCPNVVIEALACGIPVVSSRVGAVPHFVTEDCGMVVPCKDADALANALDQVLSLTWDPKKVSRTASLRAWDEVAAEVIAVFRNVLLRGTCSKGSTG